MIKKKSPIGKSNISMTLYCSYGNSECSLGVCVCVHKCGTHCLKTLEEAVEEKVPDDFAIFKGRNIPYEEIGKHRQRGWKHDPARGRDGEGRERVEEQEETKTTTLAWNTVTL